MRAYILPMGKGELGSVAEIGLEIEETMRARDVLLLTGDLTRLGLSRSASAICVKMA